MALDVLILIVPIPLLFSKETISQTRKGLLGLFFIGILINAIAAWRIVANKATEDEGADPMWIFPPIILLGETENRLSLALASIPVFWPVVAKTWQALGIVVTHEIQIERTQRPPDAGEMDRTALEHASVVANRAATEDEPNKAALGHPARLSDVCGYERKLISPFAESERKGQYQSSTQVVSLN
ncbi:uncharacterized protein GLRG_00802 [Colletotrichum graminicola M1.001]|uniref:Rhodopsin domain-containing protein n=1 Tax=Colletotrichum graminicola (strain M1.001 / M2 / FGSC 10212) TaxID=645133 RepID=E3Q3Q6_COLGM|nr:uncharacterized protein GLRG_00802 [Colletotrichum graminicola M1.001]EFQ25658.1 hypothetical protein GLRG_00802 [Colletotrichum graminicola M1.001]